jgi:hypothetical protein
MFFMRLTFLVQQILVPGDTEQNKWLCTGYDDFIFAAKLSSIEALSPHRDALASAPILAVPGGLVCSANLVHTCA